MYKVLQDTRLYIESFLKIRTKEGKIVPFKMNQAQIRLEQLVDELEKAGKPVRILVLKARQMGFSTLTEGMIYKKTATRKNVNSFIIAHTDDATTNLFNMSKLYHEENPVRPMLKASNAKELLFENPSRNIREKAAKPGLKSRIKCATAGGKGVGRSETIQNLHASEVAFWPGDKKKTLIGLMQAVPSLPGTMVIIESTANGFDYFKELCDKAAAGESEFILFFAAWYEMDEYRMAYNGEKLTEEEEELKEAFGLDNEQIMWRRWCIQNNCGGDLNLFHQEYPSTPEEAFIATGSGVFDNRAIVIRLQMLEKEPAPRRGRFIFQEEREGLDRISLKEVSFLEDEKGEIAIFKEPENGRPYVIGGDTAGEGSDYFSCQVLDNISGEQVARLHWQKCDEDEYAKQMGCLGKYYNEALLAVEVNFSTHPQRVLEYLGYRNLYEREVMDTHTGSIRKSYGFRTDGLSRPVLVAELVEYARHNLHLIHDEATLREMLTFIRNEKGRAEAEQGEHDDLVMGLGIALRSRGQQRMTTEEERKPKQSSFMKNWTADMKADYRKADTKTKEYLRKKWGDGEEMGGTEI